MKYSKHFFPIGYLFDTTIYSKSTSFISVISKYEIYVSHSWFFKILVFLYVTYLFLRIKTKLFFEKIYLTVINGSVSDATSF